MNLIFRNKDPLTQNKRDVWLRKTCRELISRLATKFKLGRVQYACDFGEQTTEYLLDQIEQEAIDQLMYVRELKRRYANISVDDQALFKLESQSTHESK